MLQSILPPSATNLSTILWTTTVLTLFFTTLRGGENITGCTTSSLLACMPLTPTSVLLFRSATTPAVSLAGDLPFLVNQGKSGSLKLDRGDWGEAHTWDAYTVPDPWLCELLWLCQSLYEELLQPVHHISEPGNKCFTPIFTGQRSQSLLFCGRWNESGHPYSSDRHWRASFICYEWASYNCLSDFYLYYILIDWRGGLDLWKAYNWCNHTLACA